MYPEVIKKQHKHNFQISKDGIYIIEITARCKNWRQNKLKLFDDDDLRVEIDGIKFPKFYPKKRRLFNGPANWNGNKLKNLSKINIFVIHLTKGAHVLRFYGDQKPVLEKIDVRKFTKNLIKKDLQPEEGERRPWFNVILVNLPVKSLSITASAQEGKAHKKNKKDDDNLKLIINGQVQKNSSPKSHKHWYWCGKIIKGRPKIFLKKLNLKSAVHYIELWADRTPTLHNLELDLGTKRIPSDSEPKWTGDFNDDTEQMILARAIFGEARSVSRKARIGVGWSIRTRVESPWWDNTYSEVILDEAQYSAFNEGDKNLPFVKNPFREEGQIDEWYECYETAGQVMKGEVKDPTDGANHYFSDYIGYPKWTKSKQAEFKIKIDNILFYYLDFRKRTGIFRKLALFAGLIILTAGIIWGLENIDFKPTVKGAVGEETYHFIIHNIRNDEVFQVSNNTGGMTQLTNNGFGKSHLILSPDKKKLGFFQDNDREGEEIDYNNYTLLKMMNIDGSEVREIYRGGYKTSYWEWLNNTEVVVYYGCGTECMVGFVVDINTAERKAQLQYGVGHEWSPDKELVLAYNYSGNYGITVGDKKGNVVFSLKREHSPYSDLVYKTKAIWSSDGNTISVVIKKENQEELERLVFDVKDDFKLVGSRTSHK